MSRRIKIGTRGSALAIVQAKKVESALKQKFPDLETEIIEIRTAGEWVPGTGEIPLSSHEGGKGLFVSAIEKEIKTHAVDIGVHSLKDVPSFLPEGLALNHFLKAGPPQDCFISTRYKTFSDMPPGTVVGSTSPRRRAIIKTQKPGLEVMNIRGNVPTRIQKLSKGGYDAIILSAAGLDRLGMRDHINHDFDTEGFVPACGQGIIAVETRKDDEDIQNFLDVISCRSTCIRAAAERTFLQVLKGSCHTPVGVFAGYDGGANTISMHCFLGSPQGTWHIRHTIKADCFSPVDAENAGNALARQIISEISTEQMAEIGLEGHV